MYINPGSGTCVSKGKRIKGERQKERAQEGARETKIRQKRTNMKKKTDRQLGRERQTDRRVGQGRPTPNRHMERVCVTHVRINVAYNTRCDECGVRIPHSTS